MKKTSYKVLHFNCASCALVMEGVCEDTPGVQKAVVNGRKKILTVDHDESVDLVKLTGALKDAGYPVEPV